MTLAADACRDQALIVFAKAPVAGQAKTRLIPAIGADRAAAIAGRLLEVAIGQAMSAGFGTVELCVTPNRSHPAFKALRQAHSSLLLTDQGEGDLGERMHGALARRLRTQTAGVLLMGSDAPDLTAQVLRDAALALTTHDAVFVPALDGGYVLVGLRSPQPHLFAAMTWSQPAVMQQTRERAQQAGLLVAELPALADIDEPEDLRRLPLRWLR